MQTLLLVLDVLLFGVNLLIAGLLWSNLTAWQQLIQMLQVYEQPEVLVSPPMEPGRTWTVGDAELAAQEGRMRAESRERAGLPVGSKRFRRTSRATG